MPGLRDHQTELPLTYAELERQASGALTPEVLSFVASGAGDGHTQRVNVSAFDRYGLIPRMLRGVEERDLSIELLGMRLATPLLLAPVGVAGLCCDDGHGDLAAARAAARTGVPLVAATLSADPLEEIAAALGDTPGLFQLYMPSDREVGESLVARAEAAGFRALVLTVDTPTPGWRPRDVELASSPSLQQRCLANFLSDPVFRSRLKRPPEEDARAAALAWAQHGRQDPALRWEDVERLRSLTSLPLLLKGICHPDDVRRAAHAGVDGIYCSNHGGRQANGGAPAIDMLRPVVEAAGDDLPVIFDSGVRGGEHVVKALALGARAVGIGRPYVWGLALGGTDGVVHVLRCLLDEADLLMAVDGYRSIADLSPEVLMEVRGLGLEPSPPD